MTVCVVVRMRGAAVCCSACQGTVVQHTLAVQSVLLVSVTEYLIVFVVVIRLF